MRKFSGLFAFLLVLVLLFAPPARAQEAGGGGEGDESLDGEIESLLDESGASGLYDLLPEESRDFLSQNGVASVDPDAILGLSFWDLLQNGWTSLKAAAGQPLGLLVSSLGVILLCALLHSMQNSFGNHTFERVFSTVSVLCISAVIILPAADLIRRTASLITEMSGFLTSFLPVYLGIITASGKPVSAMAYSAGVMGAAQVLSRVAATVLVPLLAIYLAFCLIGSAAKEIDMKGITRAVQSVVVTTLTFLLTVFVGLLSVQGMIASSADTVSLRTAKFAVGTFLPVVGGALADALGTMQSCLGIVRSTVGGFGILAVAAAFLPTVLSLLLTKLALSVAGAAGETLGTEQAASLLRSASSALSLLLGILLVFAMLFLVSISLMLALTHGS